MLSNLSRLFWQRLPIAAGRFSQTLALALTDGDWLRTWNWLAALAPLAALAFGAVVGWQIGLPSGMLVYSESFLLVCAFLALGTLSAALGLWAVVGYAVANQVFLTGSLSRSNLVTELFVARGSFLIAYALLASLCVLIPLASAGIGRHVVRGLGSSPLATITHAVARTGGHAGLVAAWALAFPTLVRPVWTWSGGGSPDVGAIATVQSNVGWLVACAAVACLLRLLLDALSETKGISSASRSVLERIHQSIPTALAPPDWLAIPLRIAIATLLLSGLLTSPSEAPLLAAALALPVGLELLLAHKGSLWVAAVARVPLLVRIGVGLTLSFLVSQQLIQLLWRTTQSFLPVVASLAVTLVVFRLCIPETSRWVRARGPRLADEAPSTATPFSLAIPKPAENRVTTPRTKVQAATAATCRQCGSEVGATDTFCGRCGAPLEQAGSATKGESDTAAACPKCGSPVSISDTFCGSCGARLHRTSSAEGSN